MGKPLLPEMSKHEMCRITNICIFVLYKMVAVSSCYTTWRKRGDILLPVLTNINVLIGQNLRTCCQWWIEGHLATYIFFFCYSTMALYPAFIKQASDRQLLQQQASEEEISKYLVIKSSIAPHCVEI